MAKAATKKASAKASSNTGGVFPLDDRVLVKPDGAETVTSGGILLPDAAQDKPTRGTVVAVGPGRLNKAGDRVAVSVSVGDVVIYGKYSGSDIKIAGEEHKLVRESDLLARVEG
jgi:chaperonin GroES